MDRDTIKNLLMTTSVVALVAAGGQEASAAVCTTSITASQGAVAQNTSVNCILIASGVTITGDVTIGPLAVIGNPPPGIEDVVEIEDATVTGGVVNNGTVQGILSVSTPEAFQIGMEMNDSTIGNGVTNAGTGVIHIDINNTHAGSTASGTGRGMAIQTTSFAGSVANNGAIGVNVFVDPVHTALAEATGMLVGVSTFSGNVINTNAISITAVADAGASTSTHAFARSRATGVRVVGPVNVDTVLLSAPPSSGFALTNNVLFRGNVVNSGVIQSTAVSTALAGIAGPGATALATADGMLVAGEDLTLSATNSGAGTFVATMTDVFIGNILNASSIQSRATAFATDGTQATPVSGPASAIAKSDAFGIRLVGDLFTADITNGATALSGSMSATVDAEFVANIVNTDTIGASALSRATAFTSSGSATAIANAHAVGIAVVGIVADVNVTSSSAASTTNNYNATFAGNILNGGHISITSNATAVADTTGLASVIVTQRGAGIEVIGANVSGTQMGSGAGNIANNLNATFLGNVGNTGAISVVGTAQGTAVANTTVLASVVINSNDAGISVTGNEINGTFLAGGIGLITLTDNFTFHGNIANAPGALIQVTDSAFGEASHNTSRGPLVASVHAGAGGIRLIGVDVTTSSTNNFEPSLVGVFLTGSVTNGGTIQSTALASAFLSSGTGSATLDTFHARADAQGIAVLGAVFTGNAFTAGTFTGNINNSGNILAFASANISADLATIHNSTGLAEAHGDGILAVLANLNGNVINSGVMTAVGIATSATSGPSIGGTTALAFADGIDVRVSTFTGSVGNSAGAIRAFAIAMNDDTFSTAMADANGIYVDFHARNSFTGNIGNTGSIFVQSIAVATALGGFAHATGAGIMLTGGEQVTGTVANGAGAPITVSAVAIGADRATATATGIAVDASTVFGAVINNGLVTSVAAAYADTAIAHAADIHIGDPGTVHGSFFSGNIINTGPMVAMATAVAFDGTAFASAEGILVANTISGSLEVVSVVFGNVINAGNITAGAFATSETVGATALAAGMFIAASFFSGNISNGGTIFAQAGAQAGDDISLPTALAQAFGIGVIGGTHDEGFGLFFEGNVSNTSTGVITATATATSLQDAGVARARAAGIEMSFGTDNFTLFGMSTISGAVINKGLIMSSAIATGAEFAVARSIGIEALTDTFFGNVSNSGTVVSTAVGIVMDGTVNVMAGGIVLAGSDHTSDATDTFFEFQSFFSGNVTNSGLVQAVAIGSGSRFGTGTALGIYLDASLASGNITNTSSGVIIANASMTIASSNTIFSAASAHATGILTFGSDFIGNVTNAGTIVANALAVQSGEGGTAIANAEGIHLQGFFFAGNIANAGGLIEAFSTASATANGFRGPESGLSATAMASAAGIDLDMVVAVGSIANTGTLVHVSTFAGNVMNGGTIVAVATATALSLNGTASAYDPATGIRINVSSFLGNVTQSGLIMAQSTATASGAFGAVAKAISAGIAVNAPVSNDSFFNESFFTGDILNSGTILVNSTANADARIEGFGTVEAGATGIRVFASIIQGNVTNNGLIVATATGVNSSFDPEPGRSSEFSPFQVYAAGIHIGGVSAVTVEGTNFVNFFGNFAPVLFFDGNISNTNTVMAFATSSNAGGAYAAGIQVDVLDAMTGNIDNAAKGLLVASAAESTNSGFSGLAQADGIYLTGAEIIGNITNEGTVMASANANALAGGFAGAHAHGIFLPRFSDQIGVGSFFSGGISNSGVIAANATAISAFGSSFASAVGIYVAANTFIGDVTNDGTISAFATASNNAGVGGQQADAAGILLNGFTFVGNVTNHGVIFAEVSGSTFGIGTAAGILIAPSTFSGNVNNTGTVAASSVGPLHALGIEVSGPLFIGNINNSGLIVATGDATGIYSFPATFLGAINNTGTIIGQGGPTDRGIRVIGPSITDGINNSGTIQGGFASVDLDEEGGAGTTVNNKSMGLLKGDVRLSSTADTLNVFGGSTVMGNITGNVTGAPGSGPHGIGNSDIVNFDLTNDGSGGTLSPSKAVSVYQFKINNVDTVNLLSGTLILDDQEIAGTVTLGPGNIDPVGLYNQVAGSTLGLVVDAGHISTLGPGTPPTVKTITMSTGPGQNIGAVLANTVNISTGATFKAFEEADYYADVNIYPNVVVGLDSLDNYLNDGTHVLSSSPLFNAFMVENGGGGDPGSDTLVLTRRPFFNPLGVGLTPNEKAAGHGLESLYGTGNSTALAVIPPLFTVDAKDYALVLKSLDGETILERPDLWTTVLDSILERLSQGESFNGQGFASAMLNHGPVQVASAGWSDNDGLVAQTTPMPGPTGYVQPWSLWVRGYGVTGSGPATINATSFDEKRYGGIGGIDYHVTNNLLVGGIFGYAHGEVNLDPPTPAKNTQDAYQFAGYAKYQQGPWYVNGVVGGGFTTNDETRQVTIPSLATVTASYNGETFTAYGEAGWDLYPMSNLKLTPLVGVGYNWLRYDAFQESGSPSALHVTAATTNNLYSALGARAQTAINIGTGAPLVPEVRVVWEHEFWNANQEMNANFGGASLFNVQGSKFSRETVLAGVGVSNNVSPDLKLFLDYDAKIQGSYIAHAVSAGLRWSFGGAMAAPPPPAPPPVPAAQPAPPPPMQAQTFVVYFDFDKSDLTPEARSIILQAATVYKQTGAVNIKVDGYTDLAGTAKYNIGLSKRRADAVRAEIVKDGVPNNAVAEAWHGKDNPAVPTPDGVREPRNRRATIMLP